MKKVTKSSRRPNRANKAARPAPRTSKANTNTALATAPLVERQIRLIRGQKVLLDTDLAALYGVATRTLNQAVRRNSKRFPEDFMFQLTPAELSSLRSQSVILKPARGQHSKFLPLAFTELGVAMLSSVLRSPRAIQTNILIVRAFVRVRELIASNKDLAARIELLEASHDRTASVIELLADEIDKVTHEVRKMKAIPPAPKRKIGFAIAAS